MEFLYLDDIFTELAMIQRKITKNLAHNRQDSMETLQDYKRNFQGHTN